MWKTILSEQFNEFTKKWKFDCKMSSSHVPRSNGSAEPAERYVQKTKTRSDIQLPLLRHRNIPRPTLGSPVQRLMSRRTETLLPLKLTTLKSSF